MVTIILQSSTAIRKSVPLKLAKAGFIVMPTHKKGGVRTSELQW